MNDEQLKEMCAQWWADRLEIPEKREAFKRALMPKVRLDEMELAVDYDPFGPLKEAIREIGISCSGRMFSARGILPFKTRMFIENGRVRVSDGYGVPYETLNKTGD